MAEPIAASSAATPPATELPAGSLRVFYALWPDAPAHTALTRIAGSVATATAGRPPAPENLHLTLAFVGEVAGERLPALTAIGARAAGAVEAFTIRFDRVGTFRGSGIAWLGTETTPPGLLALADGLAAELAAAGFRTDRRAFHVHVTLARHCRRPPPATAVVPIDWTVRAMTLTASMLERGGARYRDLAAWPLGTASS